MRPDLTQTEAELQAVLTQAVGLLPQDQLDDMAALVRAGEPGIALENFCSQLFEYDIAVPIAIVHAISRLGSGMGIDPKYWKRLAIDRE